MEPEKDERQTMVVVLSPPLRSGRDKDGIDIETCCSWLTVGDENTVRIVIRSCRLEKGSHHSFFSDVSTKNFG